MLIVSLYSAMGVLQAGSLYVDELALQNLRFWESSRYSALSEAFLSVSTLFVLRRPAHDHKLQVSVTHGRILPSGEYLRTPGNDGENWSDVEGNYLEVPAAPLAGAGVVEAALAAACFSFFFAE